MYYELRNKPNELDEQKVSVEPTANKTSFFVNNKKKEINKMKKSLNIVYNSTNRVILDFNGKVCDVRGKNMRTLNEKCQRHGQK